MKWYKVTLEMSSWTASPWQADTIFGHLCWGMRYRYGEDELLRLLEAYKAGSPPLLVSNGFPGDRLPKPVLPPQKADAAQDLEQQRQLYRQNKKTKKIKYLSRAEFESVIAGSPTMPTREIDEDLFETRRITLKNQIDRITGTTGGGGQLFPFAEYHWKTVSIYLKVADDFVDRAKSLFQYVVELGYGKRKSVGYGQVKKHKFDSFEGFLKPSQANGFVTLSNFVPSHKDPVIGNWTPMIKYGKMGELYSLEETAFKRPLLMLEAGSTFYDSPIKDFYGRLVNNISVAYREAVQYGYALPVPAKLPTLD